MEFVIARNFGIILKKNPYKIQFILFLYKYFADVICCVSKFINLSKTNNIGLTEKKYTNSEQYYGIIKCKRFCNKKILLRIANKTYTTFNRMIDLYC